MEDRRAVPSPETDRARYLRTNMTETERKVWSLLRNRQIDGFKFRRQAPLGPYVIDFLCNSARLAIEVDGPFHEDESDQRKTDWLETHGYRVLRIPVNHVDESLDDVIHGIYLELTRTSLPASVPPPGHALSARGRPPHKWGGTADLDYPSNSIRMELETFGLACGARFRTSAIRACMACFLPDR